MSLRWLLGNYIEPQWSLDAAQRREVHRLTHKKYVSSATMLGATAVWLAIAFGALKLFQRPLQDALASFGLVKFAAVLLSYFLIEAPVILVGAWSFRFIYLRPIRRAMREMGYNVCLACGYWLKGLDERTEKCPECGADMPEAAERGSD